MAYNYTNQKWEHIIGNHVFRSVILLCEPFVSMNKISDNSDMKNDLWKPNQLVFIQDGPYGDDHI